MRARLATALAVAGVLAAGATATAVNLEVLRRGETASAASPLESISFVPVAPAGTSAGRVTTSGLAAAGTRYRAGAAGIVVVDASGAVPTATVEPDAGWQVVGNGATGTQLRVVLRSATDEVTFEAVRTPEGVVTSVASHPLAAPDPAAGSTAAPTVAATPDTSVAPPASDVPPVDDASDGGDDGGAPATAEGDDDHHDDDDGHDDDDHHDDDDEHEVEDD